jgi:hypothetical protein
MILFGDIFMKLHKILYPNFKIIIENYYLQLIKIQKYYLKFMDVGMKKYILMKNNYLISKSNYLIDWLDKKLH